MTFHVGQKVVYIGGDDAPLVAALRRKFGQPQLELGNIYTIESVDADDLFPDKKSVLTLVEVENLMVGRCVFGWEPDFFRPLQEQGMSTLKAILINPKRELETVE